MHEETSAAVKSAEGSGSGGGGIGVAGDAASGKGGTYDASTNHGSRGNSSGGDGVRGGGGGSGSGIMGTEKVCGCTVIDVVDGFRFGAWRRVVGAWIVPHACFEVLLRASSAPSGRRKNRNPRREETGLQRALWYFNGMATFGVLLFHAFAAWRRRGPGRATDGRDAQDTRK